MREGGKGVNLVALYLLHLGRSLCLVRTFSSIDIVRLAPEVRLGWYGSHVWISMWWVEGVKCEKEGERQGEEEWRQTNKHTYDDDGDGSAPTAQTRSRNVSSSMARWRLVERV